MEVRIFLTAIGLFGAANFVSACGNEAKDERTADGELYEAPSRLLGKALFGREDVFVVLCESRQTCDTEFTSKTLDERACALELSDAASNAMVKFRGGNAAPVAGEFWIAGTGRETKSTGNFGHLGLYSCQVRFDDLTSIDDGAPLFWTPPPPNGQTGG